MKDGKGPIAVGLLGLLIACVAAFTIGTPAPSRRGADAAHSFLRVWRESRTATYVADYRFTRTLSDGNRFEQTTRTVQHPPNDRIVSGLGSVAGRLGGKIVRCASEPNTGSSRCFTATDASPYDEEVNDEIAGLAEYVSVDRPLYRVIEFAGSADDCFRLDLDLDVPAPPYGDHALFCFDRDTHVPTLTVIERDEATDRLEVLAVRTDVAPADLAIPTDIGQPVGVPGG